MGAASCVAVAAGELNKLESEVSVFTHPARLCAWRKAYDEVGARANRTGSMACEACAELNASKRQSPITALLLP